MKQFYVVQLLPYPNGKNEEESNIELLLNLQTTHTGLFVKLACF